MGLNNDDGLWSNLPDVDFVRRYRITACPVEGDDDVDDDDPELDDDPDEYR